MINGMLEASRGCMQEDLRMDVISNNLANSNVIGFKKDVVSFRKVLAQTSDTSDPPTSIVVKPDMEQGEIRESGNALDLAICGKGFFKVSTPDGTRYTRKGNFTLDSQGNLVTQDGYMVMGKGGPINIVGKNIVIDNKGNIKTDTGTMGQLDIVNFQKYDGLTKVGNGLFSNPQQDPEIDVSPDTQVKQGYIELSNVNIAEEMVNMIHSLRAFETYQKSIKVLDSLNDRAINQVGTLQ